MDELREVSFPFPIADAEAGPFVSYGGFDLTLRLIDYTGTPRNISFRDVPYFQLIPVDADPRGLWNDRSYLVDDSSLIARLFESGSIDKATGYQHQIICFNETGQLLEIVYREMKAE